MNGKYRVSGYGVPQQTYFWSDVIGNCCILESFSKFNYKNIDILYAWLCWSAVELWMINILPPHLTYQRTIARILGSYYYYYLSPIVIHTIGTFHSTYYKAKQRQSLILRIEREVLSADSYLFRVNCSAQIHKTRNKNWHSPHYNEIIFNIII